MKEIFKSGVGLFGKLIIVNIMCFFIVISISVLCSAAFTENVGYIAYGVKEGSEESVELYTYNYADGEDTKREEFEAQGYTITESSVRSPLSKTGNTVFLTVTQLFCLSLLIAFIYPNFWSMGTKDSNLVHFKHKKEDKFKGLKAGSIAVVPSVLLLLFLCITKSGISATFPVVLYKFLNSSVYAFIQLGSGNATTFSDLSIGSIIIFFLLIAIIPITSYVAYLLGYKNISLGEKFIYKKNKTK